MTDESLPIASDRSRRVLNLVGIGLLALLLLPMHLWALRAILYLPVWYPACVLLALGYVALIAAMLWKFRPLYRAFLLTLPGFAIVVAGWLSIRPDPHAIYPPETARVATATFSGDTVTIENIRNFDYVTEKEFTPQWETRTYDLTKLKGVDISFTYWGVKDIAHTMTSFDFGEGNYLALSIEQRRQVGRENGTLIDGFFKQFALTYIWGDERDLVRLRTNYRKGEELFLYRTTLTAQESRQLLVRMLERTNRLASHPEFYNTATDNCTNGILRHIDEARGTSVPFWKRPLRSGLFEKRGYDKAFDRQGMSFEELKAVSLVNERAAAADKAEDFSVRIRTHFKN